VEEKYVNAIDIVLKISIVFLLLYNLLNDFNSIRTLSYLLATYYIFDGVVNIKNLGRSLFDFLVAFMFIFFSLNG
jgi:hypothetical protein